MPTYLGALLFGLPLWILLFFYRKDLRHKMLFMSIFVAAIAPVDTFFIPEYWHPVTFGRLFGLPIDLFTITFGFVLGGIASVIYEEIMKKTPIRSRKKTHPDIYFLLFGPLLLVILKLLTPFNFMIDVIIATCYMIGTILLIRRDLLMDALFSGVFFGLLYAVLLAVYIYFFPQVLTAWNFQSFPQYLVGDIPHYEILWGFLTGACLGPLYEAAFGLVLRKYR